MKKFKYWEAIATLVGMIVGAGVLGLPYVVAKVGIVLGFVMLIVLGLAFTVLNLMFAEIILRTRMRHQVYGYVEKYLGKKVKYLELISAFINSYGVLLAYIIGEGVALSALFGGGAVFWSFMFFIFAAFILYFGLNLVKTIEFWMVVGFVVVIFLIFFSSRIHIDYDNFSYYNFSNWFLAYGVILFALGGVTAVVPVRQILKGNEKNMKAVIIIASLFPVLLYLLFSYVVLGVTGLRTTEVATVGLGEHIGELMIIFGNLFAIFAMATSFFTKGIVLREMYEYDFKLPRLISWFLIVSIPILMFIFGIRDFIETLSIIGGLSLGITGTLIVLMYWRVKKVGARKSELVMPNFYFIGSLLIAMFVLGFAYTLYLLFV